ncbi:hypothetical protein HDU98_010202 [Podochytrium sp. JEL0797]|nr:hypothetical protein HDU98_010202 [Podochytrium sp. JEL0797]
MSSHADTVPFPSWRTLLFLLGFRIYNALSIKTFFSPDEYWQSLEVAHEYVFGVGYLTWEWTHKVRGFAHPMLFAGVYKVVQGLGGEDTEWIIVAPKLFQAVFAVVGDVFTYMLAVKLYGKGAGKWALVASLVSFFNFFCAVRTFSNSIETSLTAVAMYYWPWKVSSKTVWTAERVREFEISLSFAAVACILRPTNAVIWIYLGIALVSQLNFGAFKVVVLRVLMIGSIALAISTLIDAQFYNEWTFVPYTFLQFNLSQGISTFYGIHTWHWYLSQGIPIVLFTFIPLTVYTLSYNNSIHHVRGVMVFTTVVYSLIAHKEFRFIMPLLPLALCAAGNSLYELQVRSSSVTSGWGQHWFRIVLSIVVLTNAMAAFYLGSVHQRGVVDVMGWLRKDVGVREGDGVLFLMPCHSTPFYSHLHREGVEMRFVTCEPPLDPLIDKETYQDESDVFYADPVAFVDRYFSKDASLGVAGKRTQTDRLMAVPGQNSYQIQEYVWPSRVVVFQVLVESLGGILEEQGYIQSFS